LSVLVQLPNSIAKLKPLDRTRLAALPSSVAAAPELERARELARQATAAKNLVGMGYSSVAPFAGMERFAGKTITPLDAFTTARLKPSPIDLPKPTGPNTERLFQATPNPPATNVTVVTAAQVIAFNQKFWGGGTG
jgi:hypothetical protein